MNNRNHSNNIIFLFKMFLIVLDVIISPKCYDTREGNIHSKTDLKGQSFRH